MRQIVLVHLSFFTFQSDDFQSGDVVFADELLLVDELTGGHDLWDEVGVVVVVVVDVIGSKSFKGTGTLKLFSCICTAGNELMPHLKQTEDYT